jgi:hypothetical protein
MIVKIAAFVCALLMAPAAFAQEADLSGVWQGMYWGGGNTPTTFQLTMHDDAGPALHGSIVEPNNLSAAGTPFLLATFAGRVDKEAISFTKTYDGVGGVTHSVAYAGTIQSQGRRIVGTWAIGDVQGQFELAR